MSRSHRRVDGGADGTKHFRDRVVILREHNTGYREYGHVVFAHARTRALASLQVTSTFHY